MNLNEFIEKKISTQKKWLHPSNDIAGRLYRKVKEWLGKK